MQIYLLEALSIRIQIFAIQKNEFNFKKIILDVRGWNSSQDKRFQKLIHVVNFFLLWKIYLWVVKFVFDQFQYSPLTCRPVAMSTTKLTHICCSKQESVIKLYTFIITNSCQVLRTKCLNKSFWQRIGIRFVDF